MTYFALAGAFMAALLGLTTMLSFVRVAAGKAKWHDNFWGPTISVIWAALMFTVAVWLFNMAANQ